VLFRSQVDHLVALFVSFLFFYSLSFSRLVRIFH